MCVEMKGHHSTHTHTPVTQLERECGQLRDQRDHHVADRRQTSHHHTQQLQAEFDKQVSIILYHLRFP